MRKQIIAFIDPVKFAAFFKDNEMPDGYFQDDSNLNNGNSILYVQNDGTNEVAAYDEFKANAASVILVEDNFDFLYTPKVPFKIVSHGQTPETQITPLNSNANFRGWEKSKEEKKLGVKVTPYKKIADLIKKNLDIKFEVIFDEIESFDPHEETLTEDIFQVIYGHKDEVSIDEVFSLRDNYLRDKIK